MRAVLADTGPLYALIDFDDRYHERARLQLTRLTVEDRSVIVLESNILESYTLILRKLGLRTAQRWLGELEQGANLLNPTADDYDLARQQVASFTDQKITLFDAALAVLSQRLGVPVWTYDFHFDVLRTEIWHGR